MNLTHCFDELLASFEPHFQSQKTFRRARTLAYSSLVTFGRHTISRLICSKNEQQKDWSADYKFFSQRLWDPHQLFLEILKECDSHPHWSNNVVLVALDETIRKKTGKKIPGVMTLRDPMSCSFHINLAPGLRYIQAAAIIKPEDQIRYNRAIPILFEEAAPAKKPKKNATAQEKQRYQQEKKNRSISLKAHQAALRIRKQVDQLHQGNTRPLCLTVDGSFCNRNFVRGLPESVVPIMRARKDLRLFTPADRIIPTVKGRLKVYGERLETPEEIRKNDNYPWLTATIFAAGKYHQTRYKTVAPVLWQRGTGQKPGRLILIAPLSYRKAKNSKLLYRDPVYLYVPNVDLPVEQLLQFYFLRWDIEVNHRDEKSLIGLGDAQVRSHQSVKRNPQFTVVIYSLLLLASLRAYGAERSLNYLPVPKWRKQIDRRPSTLDILSQFRKEIMMEQLNMDVDQYIKPKKRKRKKQPLANKNKKSSFMGDVKDQKKLLKLPINVISAILYADS
jgi:hypothetical protein